MGLIARGGVGGTDLNVLDVFVTYLIYLVWIERRRGGIEA